MNKQAISYTLGIIIVVGLYVLLMQQAIEQGRFYHAKEDYLVEASILAYNPVLKTEAGDKDKFSLLNYIQFYDFLARSNQAKPTNIIGTVLGSINDQVDTTPHEQKVQRNMIREVVPCRLLNRKLQGSIPDAAELFTAYQQQFNTVLKLQLDQPQLATIWQPITCQAKPAN